MADYEPRGVPYVTPLAGRKSGPILSNRALGPPHGPPLVKIPRGAVRTMHPKIPPNVAGVHPGDQFANRPKSHITIAASPAPGTPRVRPGAHF